MLLRYFVLLAIFQLVYTEDDEDKETIPTAILGGFFGEDAFMRRSFLVAVNTINKCMTDNVVCEQIHTSEDDVDVGVYHKVKIKAMAVETGDDVVYVYKKFGQIAGINTSFSQTENELGLSTVIGPHEDAPSFYMESLCEVHDLPHIIIRRETRSTIAPVKSINLYPDTGTLGNVYLQMIEKMKWGSFSVLYDSTSALIATQEVLRLAAPFVRDVQAFRLGSGPNFSEPLLAAKTSGHKSFILDCPYDILFDVMKQAQQLGLMSEDYRYFITSLDLQVIDLWPFRYTGANITGIRLVDPDDPFVSDFVGNRLYDFGIESVEQLRVHDALMFDSVALFAQAYKDFVYEYSDGSDSLPWPHGLSLRNYMLSSKLNGLTGPLMFDTDGVRRNFKLDILNLHQTGLAKVGSWDPNHGFDKINLANDKPMEHIRVLITMNAPYAQKVNHSERLSGNDRYEGFVIDIIKAIAKEMNFNYTFYVQEDSDNGSCEKNSVTKQCTCGGMMGKLLRDEMDMAITDLTITESRAQCITFSTTFLSLGMSILYKKPQKAKPQWYSFFMPFHWTVWMNLAFAWLVVACFFYVLSRLSPDEWANPYPCVEEPEELENQFSIDNAIWFAIGALLQQGSELAPIGQSTRILAGSWWFFCLIICNTYTANLAAFLTSEAPEIIVKDIKSLYNQTEIKYGAKKGGATFKYFEGSTQPEIRGMYENMIDPDWIKQWMVGSNDAGIALVADENNNYAFFTESPTIEYVQHRICNLEQAGGLIDQKAYAIGYAANFKYVLEANAVMSKLNERGVIKELYKSWWTEKGAVCTETTSTMPAAMTVTQLVGIFYVLGGGLFVSILVMSLEFALNVHSVSKANKVAFKEIFMEEVKFIKGMEESKPVLTKQKSSEDGSSGDIMMTEQT